MTAAVAVEHPKVGLRPAFPIMGAVFLSFMVIGMALPVLPLHVNKVLGFGPAVVGLVAGFQFIAALVSRLWSGHLSDSRGPKYAVMMGLYAAIGAGILYVLSLTVLSSPIASVALLLIGRALMGGAESLVITGGIAWALGLVSHDYHSRAISWVGMAMFAAMAIGAPVGSALFADTTFAGIAWATIILPIVALLITGRLRPYSPPAGDRAPLRSVLRAVTLPGFGFALSGITFGSITAFLTLYFALNHWSLGALAFTAFAVSLIVTRVVAGHLPDKLGGARVAIWCLLIQAIGLAAIGFASAAPLAIVGAIVCGAGFSLVFPSLGLEAVRRAPREARGTAMGIYNAFLDLTLGFVSPALGVLANLAGMRSIFLASSLAALLAVPIAMRLARRPASTPN